MLEEAADGEQHNHHRQNPPPAGVAPSQHSGDEEEGQGIQQQQLEVQARGGVLREDHDEQHAATQSLYEHQQRIPIFEGLSAFPLPEGDDDRDDQQQTGTFGRRQGEILFDELNACLEGYPTLTDQRTVFAVGIDGGAVYVVHQVVGQEILLPLVCLQVGLDAEQHIVAKGGPGVVSGTGAHHLPIAGLIVLPWGIGHLSCDTALDEVSRTQRTVVVEIVVSVDFVLGLQVIDQRLPEGNLLLWLQVEHLFGDATAVLLVFLEEEVVGIGAELVIGQAEDEPQHEIGFAEVEHSPVEGNILTLVGVVPPEGGMTIQAVDLLMGGTGEKAYLHRVEVCQVFRLIVFVGHHRRQRQKTQEQEGKSPKKDIFLFHDAKLIDIFQ